MTWDHVPVAPKQPRKVDKKKTAKDVEKVTSSVEKSTLGDLDALTALKAQMEDSAREEAKKKLEKKK